MLGLVTIGQSPRDDVVTSMLGQLEPGTVREAGALDCLTPLEIDALAPSAGEHPLVTRLRDGREVVIAKQRILQLLQHTVLRLEADGCGTICVLCTGEFPRLGQDSLVIYPDRLLVHLVEALLPQGTLGVLMPHEGQRVSMQAKWTTSTRSTVTAVASPYSGASEITSQIRALVEADARVIVLDCMGYDRNMLADARTATSRPVILANGVVGSVLREVVGWSASIVNQLQPA